MKGELIRGVMFNAEESGWVEDLDDGTFRVANIPFDGDYNVDDIVRLETFRGRRRIATLVSRSFPFRSSVEYLPSTQETWDRIGKVASDPSKGWKREGGIPGLGMIAHACSPSDVEAALREAGIEATVGISLTPEGWTP